MPTPAVSVLSIRRSFLGLMGAAATVPVLGGTAAALVRPRRGGGIDFVSVHWTGASAADPAGGRAALTVHHTATSNDDPRPGCDGPRPLRRPT